MSELSEKEQAKILRHFLLNSPPGQFNHVERNLRKLVPGDLLDRSLPGIAKRYNEEQCLPQSVPDTDEKIVICKDGLIPDTTNEYLDPNTKTVVIYDHIKKSAEGKRAANDSELPPSDVEPFRAKVDAAFKEFIARSFIDGASSVHTKRTEDGKFLLSASMSAARVNLANRWSGRSRANYSCTFVPGETSVDCAGKLTIKVHYFEEGNVQLNSEYEPSWTATAANPEDFAKSFVSGIEAADRELYTSVGSAFGDESKSVFKALRRKLPLQGNKFDWDNWNQYNLASDLTKAAS
eukprot:c4058_g1_i1.p1 GENE.c4058_g1_i1~~c4058_g1_i1.p1  ORF type:complete len:293 (-),score=64.40 c4058_g1_i1:74-952(-)